MPDLANEKQKQQQRGKKSKRKPINLGNESGHRQDLPLSHSLSESVQQEEPAPKYLIRQVNQTEGLDGVKVFCICGRSSNGKRILVGI